MRVQSVLRSRHEGSGCGQSTRVTVSPSPVPSVEHVASISDFQTLLECLQFQALLVLKADTLQP